MKKIEFGYSNDYNPKGSWEGIGIKPGLLLTDAEYYGAIKYDGNSYIVAKVIEDEYGKFPHMLGNFIVRPAIADLYADGSGVIFLDQEESILSQQLETSLNEPQNKNIITGINDIINNYNGIHFADKSFQFLTMEDSFITTSITHEAFERKNDLLKNCRSSISELQEQLNMDNNYRR